MSEKRSGCGCFGCLGNLLTFAIVSLVFYGCGSFLWNTVFVTTNIPGAEESKKVAEDSSEKFHTLLNQGKCQDIINELAGANLKANSSNVVDVCKRISKYGTVASTKLSDWNVNLSSGNSEKTVQLQYDTKFSKSLVQEEFIWRVEDGKAELEYYKIGEPTQPSTSPSPTSSSPAPAPTAKP